MPITFGGSGTVTCLDSIPLFRNRLRSRLRQAPLLGTHLFPEETVAVAARNLRGDVQHLNLSNSLRFFTASKKQSTGNKASSQPPKAKPQIQQPVNQAAERGRVGQASRGKPNKASRGRGRGGGGSEAETFLTSTPLHCQGVGATPPGLRFRPNLCLQ